MKSELFIECAKNVVDFYNATQEAIGSKNRMEYPVVKEEKKPREWYVELGEKYQNDKQPPIYYFGEEYPSSKLHPNNPIIKVREVIE